MRKEEINKIISIIYEQNEPKKLLRKFIVEFPKYAILFKKKYENYPGSTTQTTGILKRLYRKPIIDSFKEENKI